MPTASVSHGPGPRHPRSRPPRRQAWLRVIWNLCLLTVGAGMFAVAINGILIPHHFISGGIAGISLILYYIFPGLKISLTYAVMNLPLVVLGWRQVGHRFMYYTAYGTLAFTLAAEFITPPPLPVKEKVLAAVLAGIISGLGGGLTMRSAGSTGGLDILAVFVNKKYNLTIGATWIFFNGLVLLAGAFIVGLEDALYTLIFVFITAKLTDAVLTSFNQRKSILIISDHAEEIAQEILSRLNRGVTFLRGQGAYTGKDKRVILSIVTLVELSRIKEMIFSRDPDAFVVINDTLEVLGYRHGKRRVY